MTKHCNYPNKQQQGHPKKYAYNPPHFSMSTHRPAQLHSEGRSKLHTSYRGLSMLKALLIYSCSISILVLILRKTPEFSLEDFLFSSSCSEQTLSTHASPSALFTATIIEKDCGATTSESYHVLIQNNKRKSVPIEVAHFSGAYTESHRGIDVCWMNDSTLTISYKGAKNHHIDKKTIDFWGFNLTIQVAEEKESSSIPCNESNFSTK